MAYTKLGPFNNGASPYLSAATMDHIEDGIATAAATADSAVAAESSGGGAPGVVQLDSFTGATDDDKFTAALSYAAAQTFIPWIQFPARIVTLSQTRTPFSGMKLVGPGPGGASSPKDLELASQKYVSGYVKLNVGNGNSSWFVGAAGNTYNITIANMGFYGGGSTAQFWHQTAGTLYACQFHSLGFFGMQYVFGQPSTAALITQCLMTGHWTCVSFWGTPFTFGGSDNQLWLDGYLNIGPGTAGAMAGNEQFQMIFNSLAKTQVGYIYVTCQNGWNGINVKGSLTSALNFYSPSLEGLNSGTEADGNLVRWESGSGSIHSPWLGYAMKNPPATHHGYVEVLGGNLTLINPTFTLGTTAQTVPMGYASGGTLTVRDAVPDASNSTWTQKPLIQGAGGTLRVDDSVRTS